MSTSNSSERRTADGRAGSGTRRASHAGGAVSGAPSVNSTAHRQALYVVLHNRESFGDGRALARVRLSFGASLTP